MLTKIQKKSWLDILSISCSLYEDDHVEFMCRVLTQDETLVYYFHPVPKKAEYTIKAPWHTIS